MNVGVIGLGRMGGAIAWRLVKAGILVQGFDVDVVNCKEAQAMGIIIADKVEAITSAASIIWLMVPAGQIVDQVIEQLLPTLKPGDIVIDGGNSLYTDSIKRAHMLLAHSVNFLDCGTSGGVYGKDNGFSLMIGGDQVAYEKCMKLWQAIAAPEGFGRVGPSGSGHYVKIVHNGIEYGLLQAYAEGFQLLREGSFKSKHLNLVQICGIWNHGAVIRSFILQLAQDVFKHDQTLEHISGELGQLGTGKWTVEDAQKNKIPVPVIEASVKVRNQSLRTGGNYATKVISLLRNAFGGHTFKTK